jgi:hypothetical protein
MGTEAGGSRADKRSMIAPPSYWMISEEAICARADELTRREGMCSVEEGRRRAEAEYRAAAGWQTTRDRR